MSDIQRMVMDLIVKIEGTLNSTVDNVYISTTIKVLICLYAAFAAPKIPHSLVWLFDNILFRIGMAFVIVFMAVRDPAIALLLAVAFMITLQVANKHRLYNTDLSVAAPGELSWLPSVSKQTGQKSTSTTESVSQPSTVKTDIQEVAYANLDKIEKSCNSCSSVPLDSIEAIKAMQSSMPSENLKQTVVEPMAASLVESAFTSQSQLLDAESNLVPSSDQKSCPATFANQHCVQGLDEIGGFENSASYSDF